MANRFVLPAGHVEWEHLKNIPEKVREQVLARDLYQCQLCGTGGDNRLQLHHMLYRSHGGQHTQENLATVCFRCHEDIHAGRADIMVVEVWPGLWAAFPATPNRRILK